ncbi:hypothetical protein NGRA_3218 [Nosema granulosis]|uniref:Uncharacterized protein n=1 Tax=Nosema granulosis TaxID=83296 RepID=A0A9P6GV65_9MICR|nr:hypothetical protein NGRA_3218 [Nosema granulosis]
MRDCYARKIKEGDQFNKNDVNYLCVKEKENLGKCSEEEQSKKRKVEKRPYKNLRLERGVDRSETKKRQTVLDELEGEYPEVFQPDGGIAYCQLEKCKIATEK